MAEWVSEMENRQAAVEAKMKACEAQMEELKKKEKASVAFTAFIHKGGSYGPFNSDVTLTYNAVITNVGDAYNSCTGVFVAPIAGLYYFTFSYHAGGFHHGNLQLCKNGSVVVGSSHHKTDPPFAHNGGNAAFLQLQKGDQVFVRLVSGSQIWASDCRTTFSGFLVNQV